MAARAGRKGVPVALVLALTLVASAASSAFAPAAEASPSPASRVVVLDTLPAEPTSTPVVVYSPHPDDETWGMAHAIRTWVSQGRRVYCVLLTDGEDSRIYQTWYQKRNVPKRDLGLDGLFGDKWDFALERRAAYVRALGILGVDPDDITFLGAAPTQGRVGLLNGYLTTATVEPVVRDYERRFPGALHVTVMKYTDGRWFGPGDFIHHRDHSAACDVVHDMALRGEIEARFYKTYVYNWPAFMRWAPTEEYAFEAHQAKREAMIDGFGVDDPVTGALGVGYRSSKIFFWQMYFDPREYRVDPTDF